MSSYPSINKSLNSHVQGTLNLNMILLKLDSELRFYVLCSRNGFFWRLVHLRDVYYLTS